MRLQSRLDSKDVEHIEKQEGPSKKKDPASHLAATHSLSALPSISGEPLEPDTTQHNSR